MIGILKKLKRFYEKYFKSHCPDCGGVMDIIGWEWGRNVYDIVCSSELWEYIASIFETFQDELEELHNRYMEVSTARARMGMDLLERCLEGDGEA